MGFSDRVLKVLSEQNVQELFDNLDVELSDLDLGKSGNAGTLDIFPSTAARGRIRWQCADQTGDTIVTLTVAAFSAARTVTIPDPGAAADVVLTQAAQTIAGVKTFSSAVEVGTVGITGANMLIQSLNPFTIQLNDIDALQYDNVAISSFAAATDTAGNDVFIETEDAGGTATAARVAGLYNVKTGDGSASTGTFAGGAGGAVTMSTGVGGANTAAGSGDGNSDGGGGGDFTFTSGNGGASDGRNAGDDAGIGGDTIITAGNGGAQTATTTDGGDGGAGGAASLIAGNAGAASGATSTLGGVGGIATLTAGNGGAHAGNRSDADADGGAGGALNITSGTGGASDGGNSSADAGAGGKITITAGTGGNQSDGSGGNGGAGGDIDLVPGGASTSTNGTAGVAGEVTIGGSAGLLHASFFYDADAAMVSSIFFVADRAYRVKAITGRPRVVGSDGGAVTATIEKCPSGTAIGSGTDLHTGTYNLKGTADTDQSLSLSATIATIEIANGDSLNFVLTGTSTAAVGCMSVMLVPI